MGPALLALVVVLCSGVGVDGMQTGWQTISGMQSWAFASRFCFRGGGEGTLMYKVKYKAGAQVRASVQTARGDTCE